MIIVTPPIHIHQLDCSHHIQVLVKNAVFHAKLISGGSYYMPKEIMASYHTEENNTVEPLLQQPPLM